MTGLDDLANVPTPPAPPRWRRYAQTVVHLRPDQAIRLFLKRCLLRPFEREVPRIGPAPRIREGWLRPARFLNDPAAATFCPEFRSLRLAGLQGTLAEPVDWSAAGMPLLWQLELTYFHWMPLDLPWRDSRPFLLDWLEHAPRGHRTQCWNPYGVAQRVLRWTRLVRGPWWDELQDDPVAPDLMAELYTSCRFLARHQEKELLGNHLLKTAAALYAGGRFFDGAEADGWCRQAEAILRKELRAQVLADGGHYERSPMYHLIVLVDLVDTYNVAPPGGPFREVLRDSIAAMHRFASVCAHGDGEPPQFNDSVIGQSPARAEVLRCAEVGCGLEPHAGPGGFVALPQSGLFRLGDRRSGLWLDAGETGPPFLQAHAHADTASFELSVGAQRIVCDTGVYSYQDLARRAWDRSTPAHSTVSIAGESSSDCWGSFRTARRAKIRALAWEADSVSRGTGQSIAVRHDGFRHLSGSPWHDREVTFRDGVYTILDRVSARRGQVLRCDGFLYLGSGVTVSPRDQSGGDGPTGEWVFDLSHAGQSGLLVCASVSFPDPPPAAEVYLEPATFAPAFHCELAGHRLRAACVAESGRVSILWKLSIAGAPGPND